MLENLGLVVENILLFIQNYPILVSSFAGEIAILTLSFLSANGLFKGNKIKMENEFGCNFSLFKI